jgi:uncharacterized protein (DUF952 family)
LREDSRVVQTIYKILPQELWQEALKKGRFDGAAIDLADGFIHLSTIAQVAETARLHFSGQEGLVLIAVDVESLGSGLRFEPSRGGDLFPHLYASLDLDAVVWERPLPWSAVQGRHLLPQDMLS